MQHTASATRLCRTAFAVAGRRAPCTPPLAGARARRRGRSGRAECWRPTRLQSCLRRPPAPGCCRARPDVAGARAAAAGGSTGTCATRGPPPAPLRGCAAGVRAVRLRLGGMCLYHACLPLLMAEAAEPDSARWAEAAPRAGTAHAGARRVAVRTQLRFSSESHI